MCKKRWIQWTQCGRYVIQYEYGKGMAARVVFYRVDPRKTPSRHEDNTCAPIGTWTPTQICYKVIHPKTSDWPMMESNLCETELLDGDATVWNGAAVIAVLFRSRLFQKTTYDIALWKPPMESTAIVRVKNFIGFYTSSEFWHLQHDMLARVVAFENVNFEFRFSQDGLYAALILGMNAMALIENVCE